MEKNFEFEDFYTSLADNVVAFVDDSIDPMNGTAFFVHSSSFAALAREIFAYYINNVIVVEKLELDRIDYETDIVEFTQKVIKHKYVNVFTPYLGLYMAYEFCPIKSLYELNEFNNSLKEIFGHEDCFSITLLMGYEFEQFFKENLSDYDISDFEITEIPAKNDEG